MSLLILTLVVILIAALVIYAIDMVGLTAPFNNIAKLLVIVIAIVLICQRAGLV